MIYIDRYMLRDITTPRSLNSKILDETEFFPYIEALGKEEDDYTIAWGYPPKKRRFGVAETGFFWDAIHIDTIGLYQFSSLNTMNAWKIISKYDPPEDAVELIKKAPVPDSKYRQTRNTTQWTGVVFASQNPYDRSVHSVTSTADWYKLYENACKYYGKRLFVKLHPWNNNEIGERIRTIASKYGCQAEKADHRLIEKCEHVVLCSSSFAVDCLVRGIPVKQLLPGYFYQTGAVTYCAGDVKKPVKDQKHVIEFGYKLVNFLVWRYCFSMVRTTEQWKELLRVFAQDRRLFPLPLRESYGQYLRTTIQARKNAG